MKPLQDWYLNHNKTKQNDSVFIHCMIDDTLDAA